MIMVKFAHLADCHIGSWREPSLAGLSTLAFEKAIDICIDKQVDFILIAGDLFNTSLPSIDYLKKTTTKLRQLKDKGISVYMIAGSHDFSPSGKTMLDVLENAGLIKNVVKADLIDNQLRLKFTVDNKTGTKITGMLGKAGSLEKNYYEHLDRSNLESEQGYKIFIFHSLLTELKPKSLEKVDSEPLSYLPKGFDYYAGGHPHFVHSEKYESYGRIAYPGPLFPNNFKELEELKKGGFYLIDTHKSEPEWISIELYPVYSINIDADHKLPEQIDEELKKELGEDLKDNIITIRIGGILEKGKPSDINFKSIYEKAREKGAYAILKNSAKLTSKDLEDIKIEMSNISEVEDRLIEDSVNDDDIKNAKEFTKKLIKHLDTNKKEGEKVHDFEKRMIEEIDSLIEDI